MSDKPVKIVAWAWSVLACASFVWAYFYMTSFTNTMGALYAGLDVELSLLARFVFATSVYVYPIFFGSAAMIVIVKEIIMRNKIVSLLTTLAAMVGVFVTAGCIMMILNSPLAGLAEKLNK